MTEEEKKQWESDDEQDRTLDHIPQKFDCLRRVPAYKEFITDRFKRCLDLYLVPRALKQRMNVDPDSLLPKLPSPKDLRPFPTHIAVSYEGHTGMVRGVAVDSSGQWIATVSGDQTLRIWEVSSGRCFHSAQFDDTATAVAWHPKHHLLTVAANQTIFFVDPGLEPSPRKATSEGETIQEAPVPMVKDLLVFKHEVQPQISEAGGEEDKPQEGSKARAVRWHQCIIHALNQQKSMRPFAKLKGGHVQSCAFHPSNPHFLVATKTGVRIYDLQKQQPLKHLVSGAKWISSISVHPTGDHVVCGSYDRRIVWFDLDFATKPYKTLQYHDRAVRRATFHPGKFPLLAASSDDGTVSVLHAKVFDDLMQSPQIVPVKRLRDHAVNQGLGVLDCTWHPSQPWLFTAGADGRVFLWA